MVGYRCGIFLVEMLDAHGTMSNFGGEVFGEGMGRSIALGFKNWGSIRHMCREKVAERQI